MSSAAGNQAAMLGLSALTGMPLGGASAMPQGFNLAFDSSAKSSASGQAYGGGGFDGSGWTVNVNAPPSVAAPARVGSVANAATYGLPVNFTAPIGTQVQAQASPLVWLAAGALALVILKRKGKA